MTIEELTRRLEEADRVRRVLRQATLEWRAAGDKILAERRAGPKRPHHGRLAGR